MMITKIVSEAASCRIKYSRSSLMQSLVEKLSDIFYQLSWLPFISINVPATCLERTAQSNHILKVMSYAFGKTITYCCFSTEYSHLHRKKLELVKKIKKYHLNTVGVFFTKKCGFGIVDLDGGWKEAFRFSY